MSGVTKRKSPRAPSIPLDEAIDKTSMIYEKERRNPAPINIVAQNMGYKGSNNGAALAVLASLKYYNLVEKAGDGMLAVSKDFEAYKFAPSNHLKVAQVINWLKTPPVFMGLLDKYHEALPSEGTLKYDLIQMGFSPDAANGCLQAFVQSVNFAHFYEQPDFNNGVSVESKSDTSVQNKNNGVAISETNIPTNKPSSTPVDGISENIDRIPVRLTRGRRAWIEVPNPFYNSDKEQLKAQIDLLITDD